MIRISILAFVFAVLAATPFGGSLAESGSNASGQPIPRFVSLNSDEVNVRSGPGVRYPIQWIYQRRNMPMQVIAEYDTWRKVRDWEGTEGWVHRAMLSGRRGVIVIADEATLREGPNLASPAVARLINGIVGLIAECNGAWCRLETHGVEGWVPRDAVWGLFRDETVQ